MWEERIQQIAESKYPINRAKDCRVKQARQEGMRKLLATKIRKQIVESCQANVPVEQIKFNVENILDGYQRGDIHH